MRYWWVNQNQTYKYEVPGGFMWSPFKNANGARNPFYDNMDKVQPGDIVFAYAQQQVKAIGVAQKRPTLHQNLQVLKTLPTTGLKSDG